MSRPREETHAEKVRDYGIPSEHERDVAIMRIFTRAPWPDDGGFTKRFSRAFVGVPSDDAIEAVRS